MAKNNVLSESTKKKKKTLFNLLFYDETYSRMEETYNKKLLIETPPAE